MNSIRGRIKMLFSAPEGFFDIIPWLVRSFLPATPPFSTIAIVLISFTMSTFTTLISRVLIDVDNLKILTEKASHYQKLNMKVIRGKATARERLLWERKGQRESTSIQAQLMRLRMRPMLFFLIPLLIVPTLNNFYDYPLDPQGAIPIIFPFPLPSFMGTNFIVKYGQNMQNMAGKEQVFSVPSFIWFYVPTSIVISGIINKIAGLQPEIETKNRKKKKQ
ncbi:MAG: EMC3/TMCO1 family protein [Candidatus Hodarchaeota archaeon]